MQWAMIEQLRNPSPGFEDVIKTHFRVKRDYVYKTVKDWLRECQVRFCSFVLLCVSGFVCISACFFWLLFSLSLFVRASCWSVSSIAGLCVVSLRALSDAALKDPRLLQE